jgi:hypothetical protein
MPLSQFKSLTLSFTSHTNFCLFVFGATVPQWAKAPSFTRFLGHTKRRTTVAKTPLDEWSARLRDLYLTTHNTHNRQISMPPVGFEPTISAGKRWQTQALDCAATGTGHREYIPAFIISEIEWFISNVGIHKQNMIFFTRYCSIMRHSKTVPTRWTSEAFLAKFAFLCLCIQSVSTITRICLWQTSSEGINRALKFW